MVTNPKIQRKKSDIARTEAKLADVRAKLRQQREELIRLEDEEIVALFRNEVISEDAFAELLRTRRESKDEQSDDEATVISGEEELLDAYSEN